MPKEHSPPAFPGKSENQQNKTGEKVEKKRKVLGHKENNTKEGFEMDPHLPAKRGKIVERPVTRLSARKELADISYERFLAALQQPVRFSVAEKRDVEYRHLIGSDPKPSDQQEKKSCYAHAVGKGLVKILDSCGFDCEQDVVIKTLENRVGTDPQPYGAFDNITLTVRTVAKGQPDNFRDVDLRILSTVDKEPLGGVTPKMSTEELNGQHMAMVLTSVSQNHAMYVESYDPSKQEYQAINSWGQEDPRPVVPIADVDSLDYIQIKDVNVSTQTERRPFSDRTNIN